MSSGQCRQMLENFEIEFDGLVVRYRGSEVRLTGKEFDLFRYLVEREGAWSRARCRSIACGGDGADVDLRGVDAHLRHLRLKLGRARNHVDTVAGSATGSSRAPPPP